MGEVILFCAIIFITAAPLFGIGIYAFFKLVLTNEVGF